LRLKGKMYKIFVQRVLVCGSETWATKADDIQRAERAMVRWMCGVKFKDRRSNRELLDPEPVIGAKTDVKSMIMMMICCSCMIVCLCNQ